MKLSLGMIFAIILMVAFIAFAFYAIQKFFGIQKNIEAGRFVNDFQNDIDRMWRSSQGAEEIEYFVPKKVEKVCVIDYSSVLKGKDKEIGRELKQVYDNEQNLFFYPLGSAESLDAVKIKHFDIDMVTLDENPKCFDSFDGKINLTIKKDFENPLVIIE